MSISPAASAERNKNPDPSKGKSVHVQIVLFDGFDLLDALAPYEVFVTPECTLVEKSL